MATVVADADVEVLADVSKFARDLRTKLEPILKKIQAIVDIVAATEEFTKEVDRAVKDAEKESVVIPIRIDTKGLNKDVEAAKTRINRSKAAKIKVEVEVDKDAEKATGGFLKRLSKIGADAGTRFIKFFSDSFTSGLTELQSIGSKIGTTVAQGLIGLAAAGAAIAIGFPAAAGAVVLLANAIALLLPLTVAVFGPLAALGAIAGVIFLAFRDVTAAIQGDTEALNRLAPSARAVVGVLQGFKPVLKEIQQNGQEAFFSGLADPLRQLGDTILPLANDAIVGIATTINGVLKEAIDFFNSSEGNQKLVEFFEDVQSIVDEIARAAPGAGKALLALISVGTDLAEDTLPSVIDKVDELSQKIENFANEGGLEASFKRGLTFAKQLFEVVKLTVAITKSVGEAFLEGFGALIPGEDDQAKMDALIDFLKKLEATAENPLVQEGIKGIGTALFGLIAALGLAALAIGLFISALTNLILKLIEAGQAVDDFTRKAREKWDEFGIDLGGMVANTALLFGSIPGKVSAALSGLTGTVQTAFNNAFNAGYQAIRDNLNRAIGVIQTFPAAITGAFFRIPSLLYQSGQTMIQGLIDGMLSKLSSLAKAAGSLASKITGFLKLNSPSKEGPLSRREGGSMEASGQQLVKDFESGMLARLASLGSVSGTVASAVQDQLGRQLAGTLGPTAPFITPSFGNGATVSQPTLRAAATGSSERATRMGNTTTTTVNNNRTVSPTINISSTGDANTDASRMIRRMLSLGV